MRLTELSPRWVRDGEGRHGQGMSFECPHCRAEYLGVWFANPVDGGAPIEEEKRKYVDRQGKPRIRPLWHRQGENFETLSLSPSIDASEVGHWHGFITNGEVT